MTFVLFLHIAAAILTIGPVVVAMMAFARQVAAGDVGVLRFLNRVTRLYGAASVVVFLLGLWLVTLDDDSSFRDFWVSSSMTLYVVAIGLLFGLVERDQRRAIERIDAGEPASIRGRRIAGVGGAVSLIWLVIVLLMVWQPGS